MTAKKEKELLIIFLTLLAVSFLICISKCAKRIKRIWKSEENIQEHDAPEISLPQDTNIIMSYWPTIDEAIEVGIRENYLLA